MTDQQKRDQEAATEAIEKFEKKCVSQIVRQHEENGTMRSVTDDPVEYGFYEGIAHERAKLQKVREAIFTALGPIDMGLGLLPSSKETKLLIEVLALLDGKEK